MAKDVVLQVRMDSELKQQAEAVYTNLGTSFAEAVRIFARQSVLMNGMPFPVRNEIRKAGGMLSKYANPSLIEAEEGVFEKAMEEKHGKTD